MGHAGTPTLPPAVANVLASYPPRIRKRLLELRRLIFTTAAASEGVGELTETLKWGEPAYLTAATKSGTTIRIGWNHKEPTRFAMYFSCQTSLVTDFRSLFPGQLTFAGNRAIVFDQDEVIPEELMTLCIDAALTYHRRKIKPGSPASGG